MICEYCKKEKSATREHIIPKGIIDLFPECDYVFDRKIGGTKIYKSESVIKDVCSDCNNGELSKLDTYGSQFIGRYFLKEYSKDDTILIEYDYNLLSRWLLKILFNTERSLKNKTLRDTIWFDENLDYILGKKTDSKYFISLFGGLFINSSPMPLFWANNIQLDIIPNPVLLLEGLLTSYDPLGETIGINKRAKDMNLENLHLKYLIKFGSGMFLILMWDKGAEESIVKAYEKLINHMFPYKLIAEDATNLIIERCTHPFNIISTQIVDSYMGIEYADRTNCFLPQDSDPEQINKELSVGWEQYVKETRQKKLIEKNGKR